MGLHKRKAAKLKIATHIASAKAGNDLTNMWHVNINLKIFVNALVGSFFT